MPPSLHGDLKESSTDRTIGEGVCSAHEIVRRASRGIVTVVLGQATLVLLQVVGSIVLARRLDPADFGMFALILSLITWAQILSDLGLGTVLVQRAEEPAARQWRAAFTVQVIAAAAVAALLLGLARPLARAFGVGEAFIPALALSLVALLVTPLERIATSVLERRMDYGALSAISIVGGTLSTTVAVSLAREGYGVWSLIGGLMAASIGRALVGMWRARWSPGLCLERTFLIPMVRAGRPCQVADLVGFLREQTPQWIAGPLFGPTVVGYLVWARNLTYVGHYIFTTAFSRVSFSLIARWAEGAQGLARSAPRDEETGSPRASLVPLMEGVMFGLMLILTLILALLLGLAVPLIRMVYTEKWMAALPALYFFGVRMLGAGIVSLLIFFLNGIGQFRVTSRIVLAWMVLDVGAAWALAQIMEGEGVAAASALAVWLPVIWGARHLRAYGVAVRFRLVLGTPVGVGLLVGLVLHGLSPHLSAFGAVGIAAVGAVVIYGLAIWAWSAEVRQLCREIWRRWGESQRVLVPEWKR